MILKNISYALAGVLALLQINGCSPTQKMEVQKESSALVMSQATVQEWTGGAPGSGSGFTLVLPITDIVEDVVIDAVYYRKLKAEKTAVELKNNQIIASFYILTKEDLKMRGDAAGEYGNTAPVITEPLFDLKDGEAVIEFHRTGNGKVDPRYLKVTNIKEKLAVFYPSTPPQGGNN